MLPTASAEEYVRCNLSRKHLDALRKRGLTDETIQRLGYHTEYDAVKNGKTLGWEYPARALGECLVIPYFGPDNQVAHKQSAEDWLLLPDLYMRLRPDNPRQVKDDPDKVVKYESPCNVLNHAYFPCKTRAEVLADASIPLIVTEGEFKAAKADQEGFPCIGLVGVYGWQMKRETKTMPNGTKKKVGSRKLIHDLQRVTWGGRLVYLIFDSDITHKVEVQWALWWLARTLSKEGAIVKMAVLPEAADGDKVGLDDFLTANNSDALRKLMGEAKAPLRPRVKQKKRGQDLTGLDLIFKIVEKHELFYSPSDHNERYISHQRLTTELTPGGLFYDFINYEYFIRSGDYMPVEMFNQALSQLRSQCFFSGAEREVFVRLGRTPTAIYLSLNDRERNVVEIDHHGWRLIEKPPVRFRCSPTMMSVPMPKKGGTIDLLRPFLNVSHDDDFSLIVGFLIGCFNVRGPFPILVARGEAGSGKTTICKMLKKLIDNTKALSRSEPKDERNMVIASKNSWLMVFDNISKVSGASSDAYAKLSTGAGLAARELYTDDGEWVSEVKRPFILNGIEDFVKRGDLRSRCIFINFPNIPPRQRMTEEEYWSRFDVAQPLILGALLDRVSAGLRELPHLPSDLILPRMADFCKFAHACEVGSRDKPIFLEAFKAMQIVEISSELEDSILAQPLANLMSHRSEWEGTPTELLKALGALTKDTKTHRWPKTSTTFSSMLRRLAPALREATDIDIQFFRESSSGRRRKISITSPGLFGSGASDASGATQSADGETTFNDHLNINPAVRASGDQALAPDAPTAPSTDRWSAQTITEKPVSLAPDASDAPLSKSPPEATPEQPAVPHPPGRLFHQHLNLPD